MFAPERAMLRALMVAAVPGVRDVPADAFVRDVLARSPAQFRAGLRAATWVLWWWGPLLGSGLPVPFGLLGDARRARVLDSLSRSRVYLLREMPMLVKMLACFAWGATPAAQRGLGLDTPDAAAPDWARP